MKTAYQRAGGLGALAAAAVIGLAACGGGSASPPVASLNNSNGNHSGTTTTTLPKGNPTQLLDEWASCMRSHGDPNQVDPTIDSNKVIHITFPPGYGGNGPVDFGKGSNNPCNPYLQGASTALRGGKAPQKPNQAKLLKFSECMRANGVSDFPDPNGNGLSIQTHPGSDLNPTNPTFTHAAQVCGKKYTMPAFGGGPPPAGAIMAQSSGGPQSGPGGNGGAGTRSNSVSVGG
jgi:hypothetical protein